MYFHIYCTCTIILFVSLQTDLQGFSFGSINIEIDIDYAGKTNCETSKYVKVVN